VLYLPFAIVDLIQRGRSTGGSGEPPLPEARGMQGRGD
jgi:hypothetical protein